MARHREKKIGLGGHRRYARGGRFDRPSGLGIEPRALRTGAVALAVLIGGAILLVGSSAFAAEGEDGAPPPGGGGGKSDAEILAEANLLFASALTAASGIAAVSPPSNAPWVAAAASAVGVSWAKLSPIDKVNIYKGKVKG